jgi:hypothetical protein
MLPVGGFSLRSVLGLVVGAIWPGFAFRTSFAVMRLSAR